MATGEGQPQERNRRAGRRAGLLVAGVLVIGLTAFAVSRLDVHRFGHALVTASPGWIALAFLLMGLSLVLRSASWHQVLRAALPQLAIRWPPVIRATMIGVMGSAVLPGRVGEPSRVIVLARRLEGKKRELLPIITGTVFSQTLINLFALAILAGITFTGVPIFKGHILGALSAVIVPLIVCGLVLAGPRLMAIGARSRSARVARAAETGGRLLLLARQGLAVFGRLRFGSTAVAFQLMAWALQWLACYMVIRSLGLQGEANLTAAAAVLLAVNLSAILPATPSNVGVFQAACLVVLAAYGVGSGPGLAYGIILQAVEVITALALGIPALLGEGLSWRDFRGRHAVLGEEVIDAVGDSGARPAFGRDGTPGPDPSEEGDALSASR
jgi:phosphatidylinositol alpha-mannosyltransferase